jgi:vesicle-fusing ATPase
VKAASSYALTRCVDVKDLSNSLNVFRSIVEYEDFERALMDIEPKFGALSQQLKAYYCNGFVPYEDSFDY